MEYRQLDHTVLRLSRIGFGCMSLGRDQSQNDRLINQAVDTGINFFDTADIYDKGRNEESVGLALKGKREKVVLATKVGNQWKPDGSGLEWNPSGKHILSSIDGSLRRLQTDYIDLYQLHGGTMDDPIGETIEAFERLKQQGKIRHYGISSIRPNVIREYTRRSSIVSVMMQYSLLDRRPEEECLPLLGSNDTGVLCRGALAQGLLIDKPAREYLGRSAGEVDSLAKHIKGLSGPRRSAAQTALRFVLQRQEISSAVCGIHTPVQLKELVETFTTSPLLPAEVASLETAVTPNLYQDHR